jgi:hypothetical protein
MPHLKIRLCWWSGYCIGQGRVWVMEKWCTAVGWGCWWSVQGNGKKKKKKVYYTYTGSLWLIQDFFRVHLGHLFPLLPMALLFPYSLLHLRFASHPIITCTHVQCLLSLLHFPAYSTYGPSLLYKSITLTGLPLHLSCLSPWGRPNCMYLDTSLHYVICSKTGIFLAIICTEKQLTDCTRMELFYPGGGSSRFFYNIDVYILNYMVSHTWWQQSSFMSCF